MEGETGAPVALGTRGIRWHLAVRQGAAGPEYSVFVDGQLVTQGHATGEIALAEARRLLGEPDREPAPVQFGGAPPPAARPSAAGAGRAVGESDPLAAAGD